MWSEYFTCYECGCEVHECDALEIIDDEYAICEDCYEGNQ